VQPKAEGTKRMLRSVPSYRSCEGRKRFKRKHVDGVDDMALGTCQLLEKGKRPKSIATGKSEAAKKKKRKTANLQAPSEKRKNRREKCWARQPLVGKQVHEMFREESPNSSGQEKKKSKKRGNDGPSKN